ncbi:MAG: uroporphyrinogen-III synthase [Geodermatophilaceae bacterium]|nr:uroporphyrinogen-III synthase [Geodermatophilaceae bacterium]
MTRARKPTGRIIFVGAGPSDPGLLTMRANGVLTAAELIIVDPDVSAAVLAVATRAEVRPAVGDPAEVAKALLAEARSGQTVVRLVSGDPFTCDAVVKETLTVARTAVPFDVVPGVPASTAVPAYAGIAVGSTHATADLRANVDLAALATAPGTLALQVPAELIGETCAELVKSGLIGSTSACITVDGTGIGQRSVVSTVDDLASGGMAADFTGMVVLTIGPAVDKRSKLSWWESRALYGWRVLVPRTKEQASVMSERLQLHGAIPVEVATIAVEPPRTPAQMERAIKGLVTGRYGWIVFTSTNAVKAVWERFADFGLDARAFAGVKIACVGDQTAAAVEALGIRPEVVPSGEQSSEGLLEDFPPYDDVLDPIDRILLPRADIATETLAAGLRDRGWEIDDVTAYRTVRAAPPPAQTREAIKGGGFDAVCFTSSSTVRNLVGIAGKPHPRTVVACIGPQTAATAREFGLRVDVQPDVAAVEPLVDALAAYARSQAEAESDVRPPTKPRARTRAR